MLQSLDLFDAFYDEFDLYNENEAISISIKNNIYDIIQNRAYIFSATLPFSFGIPDITGQVKNTKNANNDIEEKIKNCICKYEKRLKYVNVSFISNPTNYSLIHITGYYDFQGEDLMLDFDINL